MLERLEEGPQGIKLSIEEKGFEWAKKYLEHGRVKLNDLVLVVPKEQSWVMKLPALFGENYALRIDELGNIYHQQWVSRQPEAVQAKADQYELLYPRHDRVELEYLTRIPSHKESVVIWQPAKFDTVETAIRAQEHILQNVVSGQENSDLAQASGVIANINQFSATILSGQVKEETLEVLGEKTVEMLDQYKLTRLQAVGKVKMTEQLETAFRKDSLNRINPLVTRVRLRSAYLQAVQQLIKVSRVAEKYTLNKVQLEWVRELDRWAVGTAAELLEKKILWHAGIEQNTYEPYIQRQILETIVNDIAHKVLTIPRVKPYIGVARLAAIALVGCRPGKLELNQQIIGNLDQIKWLESDLSVAQMIQRNDFKAAGRRIKTVRNHLSDILGK